jgi:hypothetical protein
VTTVELVVAKGKRPTARLLARYAGGTLDAIVATDVAEVLDPAPDVTLTLTPEDADRVRAGGLDLSVAFMRGQMKMSGDFGALLRVLPLTRADEHRTALAAALTSVL